MLTLQDLISAKAKNLSTFFADENNVRAMEEIANQAETLNLKPNVYYQFLSLDPRNPARVNKNSIQQDYDAFTRIWSDENCVNCLSKDEQLLAYYVRKFVKMAFETLTEHSPKTFYDVLNSHWANDLLPNQIAPPESSAHFFANHANLGSLHEAFAKSANLFANKSPFATLEKRSATSAPAVDDDNLLPVTHESKFPAINPDILRTLRDGFGFNEGKNTLFESLTPLHAVASTSSNDRKPNVNDFFRQARARHSASQANAVSSMDALASQSSAVASTSTNDRKREVQDALWQARAQKIATPDPRVSATLFSAPCQAPSMQDPPKKAEVSVAKSDSYDFSHPKYAGLHSSVMDQFKQMQGKTKNSVLLSLAAREALEENEDLISALSYTVPDCPVFCKDQLYDLDELLDLLIAGGDVAKNPLDINDTFTRADITGAMKFQRKIWTANEEFNRDAALNNGPK